MTRRKIRATFAVLVALSVGGCSLLVDIDSDVSSSPADGGSDASPRDDADVTDSIDGAIEAGDAGDLTDAGTDACLPPIASDSFTREVLGGFGTADVGGAWTTSSTTNTAVFADVGVINMPAGGGAEVALEQIAIRDVDAMVSVMFDKLSMPGDAGDGGEFYAHLIGRRTDAGLYSVFIYVTNQNSIRLHVRRELDGSNTTMAQSSEIPGITNTPGMKLRLRARFEGASPTRIRGRVWRDGSKEPDGWAIDTVDSAPALQVSGGLGLQGYLSSRAPNGPVMLAVDDFVARPISGCTP